MVTLNDIIEQTGKVPGVIYMDVKGYEIRALRVFSRFKELKRIIMEVHSLELLREVSKILRDNNFKIENVSKPPISKIALTLLRHPLAILRVEHVFDIRLLSRS